MAERINQDRGVMFKPHPTGVDVYMYLDEPGVYRNAFEGLVSEQMAQEAGFDTVNLGKEKLKNERLAEAQALIEKELEIAAAEREVVKENGGFKVYRVGLGGHIVEDPEGNVLTATPIPEEQAFVLLERLVPQEEAPPPAKKAPAKKSTAKKAATKETENVNEASR